MGQMPPGILEVRRSTQFLDGRHDVQRIGQDTGLVGLSEPDDAFLVHHHDRAAADAPIFVPQVEGLAGLSLGVEVRQLRVGQPSQ